MERRVLSASSGIARINTLEGHLGVRLIDACCIVLDKDGNYLKEIQDFVNDSDLVDKYEFYALSIITLGYHARYQIACGKAALPILPSTANGRDHLLDYDAIRFIDGVYTNAYIQLYQYVPHGECWSNKTYLLQFGYDEMISFGRALVGFYSQFEGLGRLAELKDCVDLDLSTDDLKVTGSTIAFRYSGVLFMTPEEREELVHCRLFFFRSGTLASFLFGGNSGDKTWNDLADGSDMATLYDNMFQYITIGNMRGAMIHS